jgi:hypothetical protein
MHFPTVIQVIIQLHTHCLGDSNLPSWDFPRIINLYIPLRNKEHAPSTLYLCFCKWPSFSATLFEFPLLGIIYFANGTMKDSMHLNFLRIGGSLQKLSSNIIKMHMQRHVNAFHDLSGGQACSTIPLLFGKCHCASLTT